MKLSVWEKVSGAIGGNRRKKHEWDMTEEQKCEKLCNYMLI